MVWVRERTIPTERPPLVGEVGEVSATFADRGCHVVVVTDPYGRILGFQEDGCKIINLEMDRFTPLRHQTSIAFVLHSNRCEPQHCSDVCGVANKMF
jgi:hypothetical protein